jgi:hypothetical protein
VNWSYVIAGVAVLGLVGWWFARPGRGGGVVDDASVTLWMLMQGDSGPEFVPCSHDDAGHGYTVRGAFYPREFVRQVKNGNGVYMMASHCLMPGDGNAGHTGSWDDLVEVEQGHFIASWVDFDRARRRLQWDSVWNRGDGSLAGLKNIASGLTVVALLILMFTTFSTRSALNRIADTNVTLTGQLAALQVPTAAAGIGAPAGDK